MVEKYIQFATYPTLGEAHAARIHLQENGVPAFLTTEDALPLFLREGSTYPVYVHEQDLDRARQVLEVK